MLVQEPLSQLRMVRLGHKLPCGSLRLPLLPSKQRSYTHLTPQDTKIPSVPVQSNLTALLAEDHLVVPPQRFFLCCSLLSVSESYPISSHPCHAFRAWNLVNFHLPSLKGLPRSIGSEPQRLAYGTL